MPRNGRHDPIRPLRHAFHRAGSFFVAGRWLAQGEGETLDTLREALACPERAAVLVGLCRAPKQGEDLDAWSARVAQYADVDPERVRQVGERIRIKEHNKM